MDIFKQQEISKSQPQVKGKLEDWYIWLVNHIPESIKEKASRMFKATKDKIMGLYKRFNGKEPEEESFNSVEPKTRIDRIENQTHIRTYQVTGSLNHDIPNLILDTICPVIKMQIRIIYSFSCSIYQE